MRLDKFLAEASIGTRKIVRNYVKEGKVSINNQIVVDPASQMEKYSDIVRFLGKEVVYTGKRYYMFHKPAECITARKDANSKTVLDYFEPDKREGLFPVGRLDKDTEGLLLLTNDGEFDHRVMHPDKHIEKTYFFWAFGSLDVTDKERLRTGITIDKGEEKTKTAKITIASEGSYRELREHMNIEEFKKIKINPYQQNVVSGYLTITEGRKHQVKRMLKAVGCYVVYLKRVSIGSLLLDESLEKGQYRELTQKEINQLLKYEEVKYE